MQLGKRGAENIHWDYSENKTEQGNPLSKLGATGSQAKL